MDNWIYKKNHDNTARFVLGQPGENNLICIGVNPSTAEPGKLDPTLTRVRNFARDNGFDGWIMLNLYPQRSTDPELMHVECDETLSMENKNHIQHTFRNYKGKIWLAPGVLIKIRPYLAECLSRIAVIGRWEAVSWVRLGELTKDGHCRHPLYLKGDAEITPLDIYEYLGDVFGIEVSRAEL